MSTTPVHADSIFLQNRYYYSRYERMIDITTVASCMITIVGIFFVLRFQAELSGSLGKVKRFLVLTPLFFGGAGFFVVSVEKVIKLFKFRDTENLKSQSPKILSPPPKYTNNSFSFEKKES